MGVRGIERCVRLQFQTHFADLIVDFVSLCLELDTSHLAGRTLGDLWCHDGNWWKEWFWFVCRELDKKPPAGRTLRDRWCHGGKSGSGL